MAWYKTNHTQLFISNDRELLNGILDIDRIGAVHGKPVYTTRLVSPGILEWYQDKEPVQAGFENDIEDNSDFQAASSTSGSSFGIVIGSILGAAAVGGLTCFLKHIKTA